MAKYTHQIDKLTNYALTLGLKNGVTLTATNNNLTISGGITLSSAKITGLATPSAGTDAVNKSYADSAISNAITALKTGFAVTFTGDGWLTTSGSYNGSTQAFTLNASHKAVTLTSGSVKSFSSTSGSKIIESLAFDDAGHITTLTVADAPDAQSYSYWGLKSVDGNKTYQINDKNTVTFGGAGAIQLAVTENADGTPIFTYSHTVSGVTAGTYGESGNKTIALGGTFVAPSFNVNANGHVVSAAARTYTLPDVSDHYISSVSGVATTKVYNGSIVQKTLKNGTDDDSETLTFSVPAATAALAGLVTADTENEQVFAGPKCFKNNVRIGTDAATAPASLIVNGDLIVKGATTTVDSSNIQVADKTIVVSKGATNAEASDLAGLAIDLGTDGAYGIVFSATENAVSLGSGTINADGEFEPTAGTMAPIAIRDDSSKFVNQHLVKWDATNKKLVDAGIVIPTTAKFTETTVAGGAGITITGGTATNGIKAYTVALAAPGTATYTQTPALITPNASQKVGFSIDSIGFDTNGRLTSHAETVIDLTSQVAAMIPSQLTSTDFTIAAGAINLKSSGSTGLVKSGTNLTWYGSIFAGSNKVATVNTTKQTVGGATTGYSIAVVKADGQYAPAGFSNSDVKITSSGSTWTAVDTEIPTNSAVENRINAKLATAVPAGVTQTIRIPIAFANKNSTTSLPAGALISKIVINVTTAYAGSGLTASIGQGSQTLGANDTDFDLTEVGYTEITPYYTVTTAGVIKFTTASGTAGAGEIIVDFIASPLA